MGHINCSANMTSLPHSYFISMLDWETDDTSLLFRCSRCSKRCSASVQHHITKPRGLHSRHTIISSLRHAWSYIMFLTFPHPIRFHTFWIRAPFPLSFLPSCVQSRLERDALFISKVAMVYSAPVSHPLISLTVFSPPLWRGDRKSGFADSD